MEFRSRVGLACWMLEGIASLDGLAVVELMATLGLIAACVRDSFRGCGPFFSFLERSLLQIRVLFSLDFMISAYFPRSTLLSRVH